MNPIEDNFESYSPLRNDDYFSLKKQLLNPQPKSAAQFRSEKV